MPEFLDPPRFGADTPKRREPAMTRILRPLAWVAPVLLAACGQGVSGRYDASPRGFFEYMEFRSGGKVEVGKFGSVSELTYVVVEGRIKVSGGGQTQILSVDKDGCLEGGKMMGRYCKK